MLIYPFLKHFFSKFGVIENMLNSENTQKSRQSWLQGYCICKFLSMWTSKKVTHYYSTDAISIVKSLHLILDIILFSIYT